MIIAEELRVNVFEIGANQVGKSGYADIPVPAQLIILNDAQIAWVKARLGENNIYRKGVEEFTKRFHDLEHLVVFYEARPLRKKQPEDAYGTHYVDARKEYPQLMYYLDAYCLAKRGECGNRKVDLTLVQHGQLADKYGDANHGPDFYWGEALLTFSEGQIKVHTRDFRATDLHVTYVRYPKRISLLDDEDGQPITWFDGRREYQDCELPYYAKDEIRDIALHLTGLYRENPNLIQAAQQRLAMNE